MEAELRPAGKTMMCGGWCRSSQDDGTNVKVYGFDQASPRVQARRLRIHLNSTSASSTEKEMAGY
jgi:hypothetical protein